MSDRPQFLVVVTHSLDGSFELFSAHYTDTDAQTMHDRLADLLAGSPDSVHILEVPEVAGVVKASAESREEHAERSASRQRTAPAAPSAPVIPPAEKPTPFKRLSAEQFAEETRALLEADANGIVTDTPMPKYDGAFS